MTTVTIPDFQWAAFYYPQLLESLIEYKRQHVPELTSEEAQEPFTQLIRMIAIVGHLNNVNVDIVANENTLPTARLRETVRNQLQLIGYPLSPAAPSQPEILGKLARVLTSSTEVISERSWVATRRQGNELIIDFELLNELTVDPTDVFTAVLADEAGSFTDWTAEANNQAGGNEFTPWATPDVKDAVYFGHANIIWSLLNVAVDAAAVGITGVWEYYDGEFRKAAPTDVTDQGGSLRFDMTGYLGTATRAGTIVRIQLNDTTTFEDVEVQFIGGVNVADTSGYLGQTTPSLVVDDYTIGSAWEELNGLVDGTADLTATGDVEYTLPQNLTENWKAVDVNGATAYWLRYRIVAVSTPTSPDIDFARLDTDNQYVVATATQGRTQREDPLGSSDGSVDQTFETAQDNFIEGSMQIWVDSEMWIQVDNFLSSEPTDKHYRVVLGDDDRATVTFGDSIAGRIPPVGVNNVVAQYRYGANLNGNVGANTITTDKSGLTNVNDITNPRPATGWQIAEGSTAASLELAKIAGPASFRTQEVALGPDDVEQLVLKFTDSTGARPFSRAKAIEEGFGPKTVEVVVVAAGGGVASPAQIEALEKHLNGDKTVSPPLPKRIVQNQEATVVNYSQKVIDITATVYGDVEEESVSNQLASVVQPEAVRPDGVTFEWEFGEDVPTSRVGHEIFVTDEDIRKVDLSVPTSDVPLTARQLPVLGTVSLAILP